MTSPLPVKPFVLPADDPPDNPFWTLFCSEKGFQIDADFMTLSAIKSIDEVC